MSKLWENRRYVIGGSIVVFMSLLLLIFRGFITDNFQSVAYQIRSPFNWLIERVSTTYSALTYFEELSAANQTLKEKNIKLIQENNDLAKYREENQQLKNLLNYQSVANQDNFTTARIYSTDPLNISNSIIVDQGARDDVSVGDHAVYNGMYLGRIVSITDRTAVVQLITDPQHKIVGEITESGATGIVHGQIGYGLVIEEVSPDTELKIGQTVSTSDIDPTLPSNLLIGEITEVFQEDQNIFQSASLQPYFDISEIKYILIQSDHEINP